MVRNVFSHMHSAFGYGKVKCSLYNAEVVRKQQEHRLWQWEKGHIKGVVSKGERQSLTDNKDTEEQGVKNRWHIQPLKASIVM